MLSFERGVYLLLALAWLWAAPLAALAELRGQVHRVANPEAPRAEWRRTPLPGAYVAVTWTISLPAPGHSPDYCRHSELARTDASGRYVMQGPGFITAALGRTAFSAYFPGLELVAFPYPGTERSEKDITLIRSQQPPDERLGRLAGMLDPGCAPDSLQDPGGQLAEYHRALLEEARSLKAESRRGRNALAMIEGAARRSANDGKPPPLRVIGVPGARERATPVQ